MSGFKIGDRVRMHPGALTGLRRGKTFSSAELWALVVGGPVAHLDGPTVTVEMPIEVQAQLGRDKPLGDYIRCWSGYLVKF